MSASERAATGPHGLPLIDGVDLVLGLSAVGNSAASYRKLMRLFCKVHAGDARQLVDMLAGGLRQEAIHLAHRLRGGAATLGILSVQEASGNCEKLLRSGAEGLDAPLAELAEALSSVITAWQRFETSRVDP